MALYKNTGVDEKRPEMVLKKAYMYSMAQKNKTEMTLKKVEMALKKTEMALKKPDMALK